MVAKRIGLYGGTFDPIHFGHLHLALEVAERYDLDQILFIPASVSPHKLDGHPPTDAKQRLRMVELAIADYPGFQVDDREIRRGGASYTLETVRELKGEGELFLVIADEIVPSLPRWKGIEDILEALPLLVGRRDSHSDQVPQTGDPKIDAAVKKGFTDMPVLEICATNVRERLRQGLPCAHLLPLPVLSYIAEHQIYKS